MSNYHDDFHPGIKEGAAYGRWGERIIRVERFSPDDGDRVPSWWVGPMENRNQGSVSHLGYSVYYELEDDGLTNEQRNKRNADDLIAKLGASGVTAEMIYDSFGVRQPAEDGA